MSIPAAAAPRNAYAFRSVTTMEIEMSDKIEIPWTARLPETMDALEDPGLQLVTLGDGGRPNTMTIGWASIGRIWGLPILTVLVRPSRHSFRLLEENGDFSVNVLPPALSDVATHCGTVSGRNEDKFESQGLTAMPGIRIITPIIGQSLIAYECRTVMKNDVLPQTLATDIRTSAYPKGDFHRIYYGQILAVRAEANARF